MADIITYLETGIKLTKEIYDLTKRYASAPENASTMRLFSDQINTLRLELLRDAIRRYENPSRKKKLKKEDVETLKVAAEKLAEQLTKACQFLKDNAPEGKMGRILWASWRERGALELFEDARAQLDIMQGVVSLAELAPNELRTLDDYKRASERIHLKHPSVGYVTTASWRSNEEVQESRRQPRMIFVESRASRGDTQSNGQEDAQRVAQSLWWCLGDENTPQTGLLPCVGRVGHRVVFLLPQNTAEHTTLQELICAKDQPVFPLEARLALARQISEALLTVHSAGIAHTAIRTSNILFLSPTKPSEGSTTNAASPQDGDNSAETNDPNTAAITDQPPKLRKRLTRVFTLGHQSTAAITPVPGKSNKKNKVKRKESASSIRSEKPGFWGSLRRRSSGRSQAAGDAEPMQNKDETDATETLSNSATVGAEIGNIPPGHGNAYLIYWYSMKHLGNPSCLLYKDWAKDIYRHPERQKKYSDQHNMGHDIYSLGVCLIEIALWKTFVLYKGDKKDHGPLMEKAGLKDAVQRGQPQDIKQCLIALAEQELPSAVGTRYATLVKLCLQCMDQEAREVWGVDFASLDRNLGCKAFRKVVLSFLLSANQTLLA